MKKKSGRFWVVGVSAPAVVTGILGRRRRLQSRGLQGQRKFQKEFAAPAGSVIFLTAIVCFSAILAVVACPLTAQEPDSHVLQNNGKPIAVPFHCKDTDVEWAGLSCTEHEPCPAYLELSAIEGDGDLILAAGNIHSEAVTLFSLLLVSRDGGRTWQEPFERIRGAGLDRIQIGSGGAAWVGGSELFPLAQNPFLLTTGDGTAWRRVSIFEEPEPGSIQQFHFDNPKDGFLVADRGLGEGNARFGRYESNDGGATWTLKEASSHPPVPGPPPQPSAWRALDDAASHAFRVERQEGGRWSTVAAFAVSAGVCRPEPAVPQP